MSNCIDVSTTVRFPPGTLDVAKLRDLLSAAEAHGERAPDTYPDSFVWWFVRGAVTLHRDSSVSWTPGVGCRSSHTWRDFHGTLDIFASIAARPFDQEIRIRDTDAPTPWHTNRIGWKL